MARVEFTVANKAQAWALADKDGSFKKDEALSKEHGISVFSSEKHPDKLIVEQEGRLAVFEPDIDTFYRYRRGK